MSEPPPPPRNRITQGLLAGLVTGLAFSWLLSALAESAGGAVIAVPILLLGGSIWRRRPFLAAFLLGFSIGALVPLLRPLGRLIF
jgi:predicted lipid-binding transport protein (Tim44 family)